MLAGAGLDFLGGMLGSSGGGKAARQQLHHQLFLDDKAREFTGYWNERQEALQRNRYQIAAADAKAAGLHPLFALGAAGASQGFMAGQSASGSAASAAVEHSGVGQALQGAGRGLQAWASRQATKQQVESNALDLAIKRKQLETLEFELEQARSSALAGATTKALATRPDLEWSPLPTPDKYPRNVNPKQVHRETVTVVGADGRTYEIPNNEIYEEPWSPATLGALWEYFKRGVSEVQHWGGLPRPPSKRW